MPVHTLAQEPCLTESPSTVLERVSLILSAFDDGTLLTLSDVFERTGLPRSSTHRMLDRLVTLGWLRRTGRDYQLGMKLVELGSRALHHDTLHRAALPLLHELHRITGMVVHLGILDGTDVLYMEKIAGRLGTLVPTRVGGRLPASSSAIGRTLLAYAEHSVGQQPVGQQLAAQLARTRETGITIERGEALRGFSCLATTVGPPGRPVAAISICGPTAQTSFDHKAVGLVRMVSAAIWQNINQCSGTSESTQRRQNMLNSLPTASINS